MRIRGLLRLTEASGIWQEEVQAYGQDCWWCQYVFRAAVFGAGNIGQRNIQAVKSILYRASHIILGEDTGSDYARNHDDGCIKWNRKSEGLAGRNYTLKEVD